VKVGKFGKVNGKKLGRRGWEKVRAFCNRALEKFENLKTGMWKIEELQRTCRRGTLCLK
jgi:hypothetical protein